jgi:hypothetical protein
LDLRTQKGILPIRTSERRIDTAANAANQPGRTAGLVAAGGLGQDEENAKKRKDPPRNNRHQGVVTPAEKAAITVKADAYSLSASTYFP